MAKNNGEKTCITCGRIITDPNNKSGLCPSCAKKGKTIGVTAGAIGIGVLMKRIGKPLWNLVIPFIKK